MTKTFLFSAAAAVMAMSAPAQAQLLGGSGGLGGALGGAVSGGAGSLRDMPTHTLRSVTRGTARGDAKTTGSQRVDRRQGSVTADRSLEGGLDLAGAKTVETPLGLNGAEGSASGRGAGSGQASAQLIGTDAVRDVAARSGDRVRTLTTTAGERASGLVGQAKAHPAMTGASGNGAGNAGGAGQASGALGNGMLAAMGSGAAAGDGAFAVAPGMPVLTGDGSRLGKVHAIVADSRGQVREVVIRTKERVFTVPAASLSGSGSALVMGEGSAATTHEPQQAHAHDPAQ